MPSGRSSGCFRRMRDGNRLVDQRVERRGADDLQHVVGFVGDRDRCGGDWNVSRSKIIVCYFTRSAYCVASRSAPVFARIRQLEHDHPAAVRIGIHGFRLVLERRVHLDDLAR